jgi:hypothetical protein
MTEYPDPVLPGPDGFAGQEKSNHSGPEWIHVGRQIDPEYERAVIAHELGHAFGIRVHAQSGLMAAVIADASLHVTPYECSLIP